MGGVVQVSRQGYSLRHQLIATLSATQAEEGRLVTAGEATLLGIKQTRKLFADARKLFGINAAITGRELETRPGLSSLRYLTM